MQGMVRIGWVACQITGLALVGLGASGCATTSLLTPHPDRTAGLIRAVEGGRPVAPARTFGRLLKGADRILYLLEAGRLAQLQGDFEASRRWYAEAIRHIRARDDEAMIRLSDAYGAFSAVLINDNAIPYQAEGYERVMLHLEQALNYLLMGDLEGAGVEIRLAAVRQAEAERRRARELEAAQQHEREWSLAQSDALRAVHARLAPMATREAQSFLNAYVYYVSAVIRELLGDEDGAYIDYKKAAALQPGHAQISPDLLRLADRLGMREEADRYRSAWPGVQPRRRPAGSAEIVLFFEEEFLPPKQEVAVWVPLPSGWTAVALPVLATPPPLGPSPELRNGSQCLGSAEPMADLSALAARALQERMPAIATRQMVRAAAKGAAVEAASRQKGGEWAAILFSLYNLISERADLRSWTTLPARASVWRGFIPAGECRLRLEQGGTVSRELAVTVPPGGCVIVWGYRAGRRLEIHGVVISQAERDLTPPG